MASKLLQSVVKPDLYREVEEAARRDQRTVSGWVRMQVLRGLADERQKKRQHTGSTKT